MRRWWPSRWPCWWRGSVGCCLVAPRRGIACGPWSSPIWLLLLFCRSSRCPVRSPQPARGMRGRTRLTGRHLPRLPPTGRCPTRRRSPCPRPMRIRTGFRLLPRMCGTPQVPHGPPLTRSPGPPRWYGQGSPLRQRRPGGRTERGIVHVMLPRRGSALVTAPRRYPERAADARHRGGAPRRGLPARPPHAPRRTGQLPFPSRVCSAVSLFHGRRRVSLGSRTVRPLSSAKPRRPWRCGRARRRRCPPTARSPSGPSALLRRT
jgi:hypothetical protein